MSQQQQQLTAAPTTEPQIERGFPANESDQNQLVPVSEAIKYRKRAQAAEQQVEQLTRQLEEQQQQQQELKASLGETRAEMELTQQLTKAGAIDVEAALLLAQKKLKTLEGNDNDTSRLVETLRRERPYLFSNAVNEVSVTLAGPTAGVQSQNHSSTSMLTRAAQQARKSGDRKDMQEYQRLRRSVLR